ncbi:phosphoglycerate dehydrogenase [Bacillus sp. JCM 19046]|nr:phosphoglycerate dehydrogenase [Bacillus sp. JCM 19045]GAF20140.1 phosphoglycerate dehydrogenase [Bacillus sp. JCM 19046]
MKTNVVFAVNQTEDRQKQLINEFHDVQFSFFSSMKEAEEKLETADVLLTFGEDIGASVLNRAKQLKWIHVLSAGVEKMPFSELTKRNILVSNSRGIHAIPMSEHAIWAMLDDVKKASIYKGAQKKKDWVRSIKPNELTDATVVILGTGAIGTMIAERARVFSMKTVGVNTDGRAVAAFDQTYSLSEWKQALQQADYVINVLPQTPQTEELLNEDAFSLIKEGAVFINLGRGKSVVENALLHAVELGKVRHAYLDVFQQEPLPVDSPLWHHEAITITPHISAATAFYMQRALEIFNKNLVVFQQKKTIYTNEVQLNKGY